jgi:exonuclease III
MDVLFWNACKSSNYSLLAEILHNFKPDLFFLAEFSINNSILDIFEELGYTLIEAPGCKRVVTFILNTRKFKLGLQSAYYSNILCDNIHFIAVHFPSQLYNNLDGLKNNLKNFRDIIDDKIGSSNKREILIIGDFNVNPFETPMINFDGFSAINCINARSTVTYIEQIRETYYNATWRLYSNNKFPGTTKYNRPSGYSFDILEHHFLDQVLLSNKLKNEILEDEIQVINKTSNYSFLIDNKKVVHSDHLPLLYKFKVK